MMLVSKLNELVTQIDLSGTFTFSEYVRMKYLMTEYGKPLSGFSDLVERMEICREVLCEPQISSQSIRS